MGKMVFVPLSDEMIYEHPELITGPIGAFGAKSISFSGLVKGAKKAESTSQGKKHRVREVDRRVTWAPMRSGTGIRA